MERWVTFDCYGTLIDWDAGIAEQLARLFPTAERMDLLARYHELEARVQKESQSLKYRAVLTQTLTQLAAEADLGLPEEEQDALARALPDWRPFPETHDALTRARDLGWRLAILSNSDPDLIAASKQLIDVTFDETVVASEIQSYKPSHGHWNEFFARTAAQREAYVHVAASLFHDIAPCNDLGLESIWINRKQEVPDISVARELPDLTTLPDVLEELVSLAR
jgi:2-haloacid dehalogenase